MYLRNGRIGVLDLSSGGFSDHELPDSAGWESVSSLSVAEALASEHGRDSVVLGTGLLTGSMLPAACAGVVRAAPGPEGHPRIMPLLGFAGLELKLSGFDFVVLKGRAERPGYVWIRDGVAEFVQASDMRGSSTWTRTDRIRELQGDSRIQVLASGPWAESGCEASQVVVNYWGGEDKSGVAAALASKNLVAVAFRGMGELELPDPERHFDDSVQMMRGHVARLGSSQGLGSYFPELAREDFSRLVHRLAGCYACPFPCRTYLKTEEDPGELRLVSKEPGYLHYDAPALMRAFQMGLDARSASRGLAACAKAGAEPVSVLSRCAASGNRIDLDAVASALSKPSEAVPSGAGNFEESFADRDVYRACLGLGLCPRYWAKAGFDFEVLWGYARSVIES